VGEAQPDRPLDWRHRPDKADTVPGSTVNGAVDGVVDGRVNGGREQRFFRGVAAVPQRPRTDGDTGELPSLPITPLGRRYPSAQATAPRQRWRSLRRGGGWTMAGLWIAVFCWGVWAVSQRDGDLVTAAFALGFLLGTAALIFTVSRLLGRMVLEGMLGRHRRGAVPSHLLVFLLLVIGAGAFLQQTWWLVAAWRWVADALL
jgi:hypothetical protein